jgi:hypothetical protein
MCSGDAGDEHHHRTGLRVSVVTRDNRTLQVSLNAFLSAGHGTVLEVFLFLSF